MKNEIAPLTTVAIDPLVRHKGLKMYFRFVRWLHQFEEHPNFNRFGAGLYQLLWVRMCGHDWKFAYQMASIYWYGKHNA